MKGFFLLFIFGVTSNISINNDEIVKKFESQIHEYIESYQTDPRMKVSKLGGGWAKQKYFIDGQNKYDVQTTNSLISPYNAYFEFNLKRLRTDFHETKEDAMQDTIFVDSITIIHKHLYSYIKDKWVIESRKHQGYFGWNDCNEIISTGENKDQKNIHGCWETNFN